MWCTTFSEWKIKIIWSPQYIQKKIWQNISVFRFNKLSIEGTCLIIIKAVMTKPLLPSYSMVKDWVDIPYDQAPFPSHSFSLAPEVLARDIPGDSVVKTLGFQCRGHGFHLVRETEILHAAPAAVPSRFCRLWLFTILWTVACQALCPWDSPGKYTGVSGHVLLQGIFLT